MWDDEFYRRYFGRRRRNPFDNFMGMGNNRSFDLEKFFNGPPFPQTPHHVKTLTIVVTEGDDEAIEKAIEMLKEMKSKEADPIEDAVEEKESDSEFDDGFQTENL
tara:strand:+ start:906 stop:1220 length:315 start_codon:yes stop_codon:yes gene_type:complete